MRERRGGKMRIGGSEGIKKREKGERREGL